MCGIYGYVGQHQAKPIILAGLKKLEYRGYDSAGLAVVSDDRMFVRKKAGKISEGLEPLLLADPVEIRGTTGIGHTRWATHGEPSDANAHPHTDKSGRIAVVHNGIIENVGYLHNRIRELQGEPRFSSGTDSEVLAWLIGAYYEKRFHLASSVADALREVVGDYAIAVACVDWPGVVVGACKGLPLVVGIGDNERFLSSDAEAIREHTLNVVYLRDGDLVALTPELQFREMKRLRSAPPTDPSAGFPHAMLSEIYEQPEVIRRISSSDGALSALRGVEQIFIPACGTSRHAALIGKYFFEEFAGIPTQVDFASEFRYSSHVTGKRPVILALSQSGETADTLACVRENKDHWTVAICNAPGSTLAREAHRVIYLDAGPEIGVAATKTFTAQLRVLASLAVPPHDKALQSALKAIPEQIEMLLAKDYEIQSIATKYANAKSFFFLGRGYNYPIALEGALKLKEISYIHAEGLPAGEMKHGPLAMIDSSTPSVIVIPNGRLYSKTFSNLREIKSRGGPVIALATEGNDSIASEVDDVIWLPETAEPFVPMLAAIPLQLFAYHIAVALGRDVDKPRGLAKSVTVE